MNVPRWAILRWTRGAMLRASPILLLLGGCSDVPPVEPEEPEDPAEPGLQWVVGYVHEITNGDLKSNVVGEIAHGGGVSVVHELGGMTQPAPPRAAVADVFTDATGTTFWVGAEAPTLNGPDPDATIGAIAGLAQLWRFRKDAPNAALRFVVSGTVLELLDDNSQPIDTAPVCPWGRRSNPTILEEVCRDVQSTTVEAVYEATVPDSVYTGGVTPTSLSFWRRSGRASIVGFADKSEPRVSVGPGFGGGRPLFHRDLSDFEIERSGLADNYVTVRLKSPIVVEVPIDTLALGTEFEVSVWSEARVWTRRRNEAYVSAFFRDPATTSGLTIEYGGLTLLEPPADPLNRISVVPAAPPCVSAPAGAIQFDSIQYYKPEWPGDDRHFAEIAVTRTGSGGTASALFTTSDGTATGGARDEPGSDYEPVSTHVRFDPGETGTQAVYVPIIGDLEAEGDETVVLTLSDPSGCGGLGDVTSATLTIWDDDEGGLQEDAYTIGGTVTGLEGSGLVLTNNSTDHLEITDNGPFAFDRDYATGVIYNVRVETQPDDPAQSCTVTNGNGTVAAEDVTDIEVDCETLPPAGENLDASFGAGGKVTLEVNYTGVQGDAPDLALQDDGRIVVVSGNTLARYNVDGSLDGSFGTGGVVTVDFYGSRDRLNAVGVQPDGRIVVAGYSLDGANSPTQDDIIVARYNADGTLDTTFGTGGEVVTDFESHQDIAYDLLIQPDGKIVVTGLAATIDDGGFGVYYPDFAAARYTSDGELDDSFGTGGKVTTNIAGETDFSYAAALQLDGKIVLAGRVAPSGGANPDIGVVRYNADGSLDSSFGDGGILRNQTDIWDEAADVAVQPDGKIVVVGFTLHEGGIVNPAPDTLTIERYSADGTYDPTFGTGGRVQTPLMVPGRAIALQPDGKIVIAGVEQSGASADYAIARFTPTGELDTSFGTDGLIQVDFFGDLDLANAVALQPDGKVGVAGSVRNGASTLLGLIRVLP